MSPTESTRKISMKLYVNEDEDSPPFAEVDNDFVDLLLGFLTYPIGSVISKLGGRSGILCMDNLNKSVEVLKPGNCFGSNELIEKLLNPKLPLYFKVRNQLIELDEENQTQSYFTCSGICTFSFKVQNKLCSCTYNKQLTLTDPKHGSTHDPITGGYMRFSRYMVTDNLVISQPTSYMVIADILKKAPGKRIHARNVEIGEHEALALLRACITSQNVLTNALLGVERGKRRFRSY